MSLAPPPIARPAGAQLVHSSYVVSSLAQPLTECVLNSLAAGAREVHVEVDVATFSFKVTDTGTGIAADVLAAVPACGSAPGCSGPLAALCNSAVVELTSRAAGSFETYTKVICGGTAAKFGLALEQRSRQGTVLQARDLWHNAPVRRKAMLSAGVLKEVERCREAVFRLALVQPGVTFTLFDRGRKAFLLRMLKGRSLQQDVSDAFGQPPRGSLVVVQGAAQRSGIANISGWAVLPPHGHTNTSRQLVYVNSQPVSAGPLAKMVDALFAQLYKTHAKMAHDRKGGAGDLLSTKKLGNRHAQFLLQLHCPGQGACSVGPDGEVQFADWDGALAAAKLAVLRAWRPTLSLALLKVLEGLEQGSKSGRTSKQAAQPEAAAAAEAGGAGSFKEWAAQQTANSPLMELLQNRGQPSGLGKGSGNARAAGSKGSGGSSQDPHNRSGPQAARPPFLAGVRASLSSRLVRYIESDAPANSQLGTFVTVVQPSEPCQPQERNTASSSEQQRAPKRVKTGGTTDMGVSLHSRGFADTADLTQQDGGQGGTSAGAEPFQRHLTFVQQGDGMKTLLDSWQPSRSGATALLEEQMGGAYGAADADVLLGAWQPLPPAKLEAITSAAASASASAGPRKHLTSQPLPHPEPLGHPQPRLSSLTSSEQHLLAATARGVPISTRPRPQSAPPHAKLRSRAVHTNPANSLRALGQAAAAASAVHEGIRGQDTVSGLGSKSGRNFIAWRQQRPAVAASKAQSVRAYAYRHAGRGLGEQTTGSGGPTLMPQPPVLSGEERATAVQPPTGSPALRPTALAAAALPSFLQPDASGLEGLLSSWRNPAMVPQGPGSSQDVLQLESVEKEVFAPLKAAGLSREQLQAGRALAQVDSKFIPVTCGSILALVDQHAADERVQLELLRHQLVGSGSRPRLRQSMALRPPQPLALTLAETQLLETFGDKVRAWGWEWAQHGGSGGGGRHVLTHVPLVFGTALGGTDMKLFLHRLHDTCGAGGLPAGVIRVLNSKACRSAIMFGDELVQAECQALVDNLKETQLYNCCAHGRPTTAALVDLQMLRQALKLRASSRTLGPQDKGSASTAAGLRGRLRRYIDNC